MTKNELSCSFYVTPCYCCVSWDIAPNFVIKLFLSFGEPSSQTISSQHSLSAPLPHHMVWPKQPQYLHGSLASNAMGRLHQTLWVACIKRYGSLASNAMGRLHQTLWVACIKRYGSLASNAMGRLHQTLWVACIKRYGSLASNAMGRLHQTLWVACIKRSLNLCNSRFLSINGICFSLL